MQKKMEAGLVYIGDGKFKAYGPVMAEEIDRVFEKGRPYVAHFPELSDEKQRTTLQNKAMHLWFKKVAIWLTESGLSVEFVVSQLRKSTVPWTQETVKEVIWRNIQRAITGKESTASTSTIDVIDTHKQVEEFFRERLKANPGDWPEWPDEYTRRLEQWENENA